MPNGPRLIIDGACYHLIIRGNQKQKVFISDDDYYLYLNKLKKYKKRFKFNLYGYCLIPNHIHLIGELNGGNNSLSKFMQGLNRSYTAYFNNTYEKVGHLWQGRFKSKVVTKDKYLIDCINYIELNPVRAGIVKAPHEYKWSSYSERNLFKGFNMLDDLNF